MLELNASKEVRNPLVRCIILSCIIVTLYPSAYCLILLSDTTTSSNFKMESRCAYPTVAQNTSTIEINFFITTTTFYPKVHRIYI